MITALAALRLPSAKLSVEEQQAVHETLGDIEAHVVEQMRMGGIVMRLFVTNPNVLAGVTAELKQCGWIPQWQPIAEPSPLSRGENRHVGFQLVLTPNDAAYAAAGSHLQ